MSVLIKSSSTNLNNLFDIFVRVSWRGGSSEMDEIRVGKILRAIT